METITRRKKIIKSCKFKSYYVVWKLPCFVFPSNPMISFKSYYVVWKPALGIRNNSAFFWFKSYYVVWKPVCFERVSNIIYSLNRTMQYGNENTDEYNYFPNSFKSYYVVWKPNLGRIIPIFATMFKSYYVVWKLVYP